MGVKDAKAELLDCVGMTEGQALEKGLFVKAIAFAKAKIAGWNRRDEWKAKTRKRERA